MPDRSMARGAGKLCALVLAATLAGCAWDPYTQSYVPCCAAPPPGAPPPAAWQQPPPGPYQQAPQTAYAQPPTGAHRGGGMMARFEAANVTHDGRLTLAQAEEAGWTRIARNFYAIDVQRKGFVTPQDIRAWNRARRAARQGGAPMPPQPEY